jgi:hypothetical protein
MVAGLVAMAIAGACEGNRSLEPEPLSDVVQEDPQVLPPPPGATARVETKTITSLHASDELLSACASPGTTFTRAEFQYLPAFSFFSLRPDDTRVGNFGRDLAAEYLTKTVPEATYQVPPPPAAAQAVAVAPQWQRVDVRGDLIYPDETLGYEYTYRYFAGWKWVTGPCHQQGGGN